MDVGMIFAIVFTVFVVVFLLTGGIKLVMDLLGLGEEAQIKTQMDNLDNVVSKEVYWLPIGGSKPFEFTLTPGTDRVCFFDYLDPRANPEMGWEGEPQIESLIRHENYTVFLFKRDGEGKGYRIDKAMVMENFCTRSSLDLMLISRGRYVEIVPAVS